MGRARPHRGPTRENLGATDAGIILFRKVMEENLRIVEDGGDPMNTFRDPAQNECVLLPNEAARSRLRRPRRALVRSGSAHAGTLRCRSSSENPFIVVIAA